MVNFGDEEDDESDEEEEGDFETLEDETFDIDDLSSAGNPTTASSPNVVPTDPVVNGQIPNLNYSNPSAESVRQSSNSSSVELQDSNEDRFRDPAPRPPKLSSRHSHNDASEVYDRTPLSAPPNFSSHRMASSASRRRDRGEDGDRDHIHEPLNSKWNVAGSIRKSMSRERGQLPTLAKLRAREGDGETSEGRAFAVVGADSDTSVVSLTSLFNFSLNPSTSFLSSRFADATFSQNVRRAIARRTWTTPMTREVISAGVD